MPRITVVELYRYREWTESLGSDREWIIQDQQTRFYNLLQKVSSKNNGFAIPLRYDYYIVLANNISRSVHEEIHTILSSTSPVPVRIVSIPHPYPLTAQLLATSILASTTKSFIYRGGVEDPVVIVHMDIDGITQLTYETSIYESYVSILEFLANVANTVLRYGGITGYLGGDNIVAILPYTIYREYLEILPDYVKAGVGVSESPRKALELATKALDDIRRVRGKKYLINLDASLTQE